MENLMQSIAGINSIINEFVWVKLGLIMLLGTGILMTVLTKFFQISHIGHWMKHTIGSLFKKEVSSHSKDRASISQFQALCTALAATIGVGNIAGVSALQTASVLISTVKSPAVSWLSCFPYFVSSHPSVSATWGRLTKSWQIWNLRSLFPHFPISV